MEPVCGDRPEGSRCERPVRATGRGGKPKHRSGSQIAVTRAPQGGPGAPARGSRKLDGASREACFRRPPGPARSRSWAAHAAPAYPSHPAGFSAGLEGACNKFGQGRNDEPTIQASHTQEAKPPAGVIARHPEKAQRVAREGVEGGKEAFAPGEAVSFGRSLPGSHVPAQEALPQGRGRYRGSRGSPCPPRRSVGQRTFPACAKAVGSLGSTNIRDQV